MRKKTCYWKKINYINENRVFGIELNENMYMVKHLI